MKFSIIGGAELYRQAPPLAETLYLTEIEADFAADTFFPEVAPEHWQEISRSQTARHDGLNYAFGESA